MFSFGFVTMKLDSPSSARCSQAQRSTSRQSEDGRVSPGKYWWGGSSPTRQRSHDSFFALDSVAAYVSGQILRTQEVGARSTMSPCVRIHGCGTLKCPLTHFVASTDLHGVPVFRLRRGLRCLELCIFLDREGVSGLRP